jgi:hypothetical protein
MDLSNFVKTTLNPEIAAQMASSIAWRIDTLLQQQARELLKELKPEFSRQGIDELNDIEAAIAGAVMQEYSSTQAGGERGGNISNIQMLNPMRDEWHQLAKQLTHLTFDKEGVGRDYEIPTLDEVFFTPITLKVKPEAQRRTIKRAERSADAYGLDADQKAKRIKQAVTRKEDKAADTSRFLTDQQPTVNTLYRMASRVDLPEAITHEFDELPNRIKLTLLTTARDSAMRLAEWAEDYFWLSEPEYDDLISCSMKVDKQLRGHIDHLQKETA